MFNFGITEIMVIAVIGLVVIGPERLPKVARTLGHMFSRMQRYVSDVKSDISKEMQLEELKAMQKSMKETAAEIQESVSEQVNFIETEVEDADKSVKKTVETGLESSTKASNQINTSKAQPQPAPEKDEPPTDKSEGVASDRAEPAEFPDDPSVELPQRKITKKLEVLIWLVVLVSVQRPMHRYRIRKCRPGNPKRLTSKKIVRSLELS